MAQLAITVAIAAQLGDAPSGSEEDGVTDTVVRVPIDGQALDAGGVASFAIGDNDDAWPSTIGTAEGVAAVAPGRDEPVRWGIGGDFARVYVPAAPPRLDAVERRTAGADDRTRAGVPVGEGAYLDGEIGAIIGRYFGVEFVETVLRIGQCESRWRADAISADGQNWGALQVNLVHLSRVGGDPYALLDLETNIRVASEIWRDNGGFQPWACY